MELAKEDHAAISGFEPANRLRAIGVSAARETILPCPWAQIECTPG